MGRGFLSPGVRLDSGRVVGQLLQNGVEHRIEDFVDVSDPRLLGKAHAVRDPGVPATNNFCRRNGLVREVVAIISFELDNFQEGFLTRIVLRVPTVVPLGKQLIQ